MATDADRILHTIIDGQIKRGNFTVGSAADAALCPIAKLDNLKPLQIPNLRPFVLDGLKYRAKQYQPAIKKGAARLERDEEDGQPDFSEMDVGFSRILYTPAALDELEGTVRLQPIEMSLEQLRMHIALKRRKADQTWKSADYLERIIERYLNEWSLNPELTLGRIIAASDGRGGGTAA